MSRSSESVVDVLGERGPFAKLLPGFAPRAQQQALAQAIDNALLEGGTLIGEAGTGVGKTFAYLVPAILSGLKVIISTGTRHLQDQLFYNDLPLVRQALQSDVKVALLKGRGNYLCRHRLAQAAEHPLLSHAELLSQLTQVQHWAATTKTGDISEVNALAEDAPIWRYVTSDADFCAGHEPDQLGDCFVHRARRTAQSSDIVVVNHHLFFADLALKEEGFGEILPSADVFVLDEAHQIPEVASQFFAKRFSSRQLTDLVLDSIAEQMRDAPDMGELRDAITVLEKASRDFRLAFGVRPQRDAWRQVLDNQAIRTSVGELQQAYGALGEQLELAAPRGKGLTACLRRCLAQIEVLEHFIAPETQGQWVHWYETFRTGYVLSLTALDIAEPYQRAVNTLSASWLYTSATLSVGNSFAHFRGQLGIDEVSECQQNSPFDYQRNALLYLPPNMPKPSADTYNQKVIEAALPVMRASGGRTFLLFTSYRALNQAAQWLQDKTDLPLLVQGDSPKRELIAEFQSLGNAVLLGTSSFWEGVDVRGQALSCVIIDKLPFASPGDPVMQARINVMREHGSNPFFDYQVPQAAIALKQGVGRLIRDVNDRGVVMICDPRLKTKSYGRLFIQSYLKFRLPIPSKVCRIFLPGRHYKSPRHRYGNRSL